MRQRVTRTDGTASARTGKHIGRGTVLLIAALSLLPMIFAACGPDAQAGAQLAKNQTFIWPYYPAQTVSDVVLDPAKVESLYDANLLQMIYTNLVTLNSSLQVVPDAATGWDISTDGLTYTFHLRTGLRYSDGNTITSTDFAYSINRALDPATGSQVSYYLCGIKDANVFNPGACSSNPNGPQTHHSLINDSITTPDPQTLVITLQQPAGYFLEALSYPTSDPVESSFLSSSQGKNGAWVNHLDQGGCSGPFQIKSYGNGKQLTFVPNPYWEAAFGKKLTVTSVVRPLIATDDQAYQNYRAETFGYDEADVPADQYSLAFGQPDFHEVPTLETEYFGLNAAMAPFNDSDANGHTDFHSRIIRQAFDLALNRQILVDRILNGGATPTFHIVPQGMPGFNSQLVNPQPDGTQAITGNQQAAVKLMDQARAQCPAQPPAGTTGTTPTTPMPDFCPYITGSHPQAINLYVPTGQTTTQLAQAAAAQWDAILGVNVNVVSVTFQTVVSKLYWGQHDMQMYEIGWIADYPDPQDWLSLQFKTGVPYNSMNLHDPAFDKLVTEADGLSNQSKRMELYGQAEQIAINDAVWLPFDQGKTTWRMLSTVHGFGYNSFGLMQDLAWPNVQILAN